MSDEWTSIKAEYLDGVPPKKLAEKYKVSYSTLKSKATKEGWTTAKRIISNQVQLDLTEKIKRYSNDAIEVLHNVMKADETSNRDKVSAAKSILDISGLKVARQEITGANGEPIGVQKVFITQKEVKDTDKHIDEIIND